MQLRNTIDQFFPTNILLPQIVQSAQNTLQTALSNFGWVDTILALLEQISRNFSELDGKIEVGLAGWEFGGPIHETLAERCVGDGEVVAYIITFQFFQVEQGGVFSALWSKSRHGDGCCRFGCNAIQRICETGGSGFLDILSAGWGAVIKGMCGA